MMEDKIDDIVIPILRTIQADLSVVKSDVAVLKERTGKIDIRLGIVEAHMSGFMSSARYLEREIDQLRGRVEALEQSAGNESPR
jgi:hypothetical protein